MVVDDDLAVLETLETMLEAYQVTTFHDGFAALEHLKHGPVDLLVADLRMPRLDGFTLITEARRRNPKMKVLLVTAYLSPDTPADGKLVGRHADAWLPKPFTREELLSKVHELLGT